MKLCTNLQQRVLDLETTKTTQANEIASLKRRVKKLEQKKRSRTHGLKRLYKGSVADIDANKDIYLVNVHTDEDMFGVNDFDGDEVIVDNVDVIKTAKETRSVVEEVNAVIEKAKLPSAAEETVNVVATKVSTASTFPVSAATTTTTTTIITNDEINLAKALAKLKSAKLPTQGIAFRKPSESITITPTTTAATTIIATSTRPKDKGIVIHEHEQAPTPTVSSQQPSQVKVQDKGKGKMVEPEPMSKKDLLTWDDVQAKIEADYQLAQKLQAQEQEELTDEEMARLFIQFLEKRRKHFAAKRAEEKRNRPPTRAQQRSIMTELVKESSKKAETEMEENKKAETKVMEGSFKRVGEELEQERIKKQKMDEDKEIAEQSFKI
ncbi:hypothetical protein Tco_1018797 [Tanacetum coccineum]|uniref:Uncharacterized protein n=1 Tax=Tanacetum coccineum TaxID=301880 RepID=A0ABQ5FXA5_9ASTR